MSAPIAIKAVTNGSMLLLFKLSLPVIWQGEVKLAAAKAVNNRHGVPASWK